jgi:regulator of sigma E protease
LSFNLNSIWQTLLLLSVLVVVHEYGHFITARLFGVTVYEFSVGFGPLIAKWKHQGIQYSLRWVLLGGFVKIAGMDIALEGEPENPEVGPDEVAIHPFHAVAFWKRVLIVAAGPFFNVFLGILLAFCLAAFVGFPSGNGIKDNPTVSLAIPGGPAFEAGIRPGDKIVAINDQPVRKWMEIPTLIQKFSPEKIKFDLIRNPGKVKLVKYIVPLYEPQVKRYFIGIEGTNSLVRWSVKDAAKYALAEPWLFFRQFKLTLELIVKKQAKGALIGPIGMTAIIEQYSRLPLIHVIYRFLELAIGINMCLFLFNMLPLPLPLLDGGWIVIMTLEKLMGREFSANQKAAAQMVGLVAVLFLGVWIAYGDVMMLIKRFFGG